MVAQFVFLTKTRWDEPPRLRHQLARLLADAGHRVVFLQKPLPFWRKAKPPREVHPNITVADYHELLHHKLRLFPALQRLNAFVARRSIHAAMVAAGVADDASVVNFNYEYYFLRDLRVHGRKITIINDDHIANALFGWRRPLEWALSRTCKASDRVLTVSSPLVEKLAAHCAPDLFRPWADVSYAPPVVSRRDTLLFWGYINDRLDFARIEQLADALPACHLMFVGPVEPSAQARMRELAARGNVDLRPACALLELPVDRVLAALIPYRTGSDRIDAIELSNKALQLLARGLPLLISGMPRFVDKPFVYRLDAHNSDPGTVVARIRDEFDGCQSKIEDFVSRNSAEARLQQFMEIIAA